MLHIWKNKTCWPEIVALVVELAALAVDGVLDHVHDLVVGGEQELQAELLQEDPDSQGGASHLKIDQIDEKEK